MKKYLFLLLAVSMAAVAYTQRVAKITYNYNTIQIIDDNAKYESSAEIVFSVSQTSFYLSYKLYDGKSYTLTGTRKNAWKISHSRGVKSEYAVFDTGGENILVTILNDGKGIGLASIDDLKSPTTILLNR
jgi:hypothetical protein